MSTEVELREVSKAYGEALAVDRVSLAVAKGELVALLGPSGCGKTTSLRMIAGFVEPSAGSVFIAGQDVTRTPPHKRDAGLVFQSYALFPHLSVAENIAFGLKRRGVARAEIAERVQRMIKLLRLDGLEHRRPAQLSGGQQQRVAVGRALVINPTVILLDEPFSNLDAQLRESTRDELRRLQQELTLTAIFVTHDQAEAMAIADRIAVMNRGRIEQIDAPTTLYRRPRTRFVAGFVGRANILDARREAPGRARAREGIALEFATHELPERFAAVLRPEAITLDAAPEGGTGGANEALGRVETRSFFGATAQLVVTLDAGARLIVEGGGTLTERFAPGDRVVARWPREAIVACSE